jgi:hypothetical protein
MAWLPICPAWLRGQRFLYLHTDIPSTPCSQTIRARIPNERLGLQMSTWTDVPDGVLHWVLQPSPSIAAVLCQRLGRPNSLVADGHMA